MPTFTYLSNGMLQEILNRAEQEERDALSKVLHDGSTRSLSPITLQIQICAAGGNAVANYIRGGEGISYAELLFDAAKHLKIEGITSVYSRRHSDLCLDALDRLSSNDAKSVSPDRRLELVDAYVNEMERKLLAKLMAVAYENATPAQRAAVDAEIAKLAKTPEGKSMSGLSTTAALLAIGNLGGFATYTLMSTVLSALSLGTLGFGAYTLASTLLSVVLGPVGWLSLALYGVIKLGGAEATKTVRLAAICAMTSQRIRERRQKRK